MVHAKDSAVKHVCKLEYCYGIFTSLFLSKLCRLGWLAVVNALHGLELASDRNVQDGIIR